MLLGLIYPLELHIFVCVLRNLIKHISANCKECCDPGKTVKYLFDSGEISYTTEYYLEIWYFYLEALNLYPKSRQQKKKAREHTCEMFGISERLFSVIRNRYRRKFKEQSKKLNKR